MDPGVQRWQKKQLNFMVNWESVTDPKELKVLIKANWGKLVDAQRLGDVLKHYYKLSKKTAGECWPEISEMAKSVFNKTP